MRILLDPTPAPESGGAPAPVQPSIQTTLQSLPPTATVQAAPAEVKPPVPPPVVSIPVDVYQRYQDTEARLRDYDAAKAREIEEANRKADLATAAKDGAEAALNLANTRSREQLDTEAAAHRQTRAAWDGATAGLEISQALSAYEFVSPAARADFLAKVGPLFRVNDDGKGNRTVATADFRPVAEVVKVLLQGDDSYRLKPSTQGGTARPNADRGANLPQDDAPKTDIEQLFYDSLQRRAGAASRGEQAGVSYSGGWETRIGRN